MVSKKNISHLVESGRLRQILDHGYLSSEEIQYVIDAVSEKLVDRKR